MGPPFSLNIMESGWGPWSKQIGGICSNFVALSSKYIFVFVFVLNHWIGRKIKIKHGKERETQSKCRICFHNSQTTPVNTQINKASSLIEWFILVSVNVVFNKGHGLRPEITNGIFIY